MKNKESIVAKVTPLGIKRTCPSCNARFYDLNKNPASCPKCDHSFNPNVPTRTRRSRKATPAPGGQDKEDMLLKHMAKAKASKNVRKEPEEEIEEFEDLDKSSADDSIEELDDMDDIEGIEEIEDIDDDEAMDDDISLEDAVVGGAKLIDEVEDEEEEDEEEDDDDTPKSSRTRKRK